MAHSPYEIGPFTLNDRSCQAASLFQHTMSYWQSSHLGARSGNRLYSLRPSISEPVWFFTQIKKNV
jgi:hypothetical protein